MTTAVLVVAALLAAAVYLSWTAGRIDRLHARVEAARNALDAQLVRRAAAARALGERAAAHSREPERRAAGDALVAAAAAALNAQPSRREHAENDLSRALRRSLPRLADGDPDLEGLLAELDVAVTRVGLARTFHNEAVRDTRALRGRRLPRLFRLAGRAPMPEFFEIDDTAIPAPGAPGR